MELPKNGGKDDARGFNGISNCRNRGIVFSFRKKKKQIKTSDEISHRSFQ